jgi:LPS export ABC transporter protein LptC
MINRTSLLIAVIIIVTGLILSCENRIPQIPKSDLLTLPSLTGRDVETVLTDSGRIQLIMSSPLVEQYEKAENPYSEFRSGLKVIVYNGQKDPVGSVTAKYGKCTNNNLWELRDSVVVINENNEKLETEVLFWNQEKDLIYTDRFVKITSEDEVIQGIGFESDSHLSKQKIKKVTAEIYLKDEE